VQGPGFDPRTKKEKTKKKKKGVKGVRGSLQPLNDDKYWMLTIGLDLA
jgi:hypothetical protein